MESPHFTLDYGLHGLLKLLADYKFSTVLDIGSGEGHHKRVLEYFGKKVFSVDMVTNADYVGDFLDIKLDRQFDAIWCSHVLEHQKNVGAFLDKVYSALKPGGVLAIIVPLHDRDILFPGHLTSWSVPLLCYNLVMAGFDCSKASILRLYELSLIVEKKDAPHFEREKNSAYGSLIPERQDNSREDESPLQHIDSYFPFPALQGVQVSGNWQINWGNVFEYAIRTNKPIPTVESKAIGPKTDTSHLQPKIVKYHWLKKGINNLRE